MPPSPGFNNMSIGLTGDGEPERICRTWVSSDLLPLLGVWLPASGSIRRLEQLAAGYR